ncbi:MAG: M14 family zinc carboxypeptidase [Gemmatimonadota bacterium]
MPAFRAHATCAALIMVLAALAAPLAAQQRLDEEYTRLIRDRTTEPFFLTPLVDHLPLSERVPTPLEHFGTIAGDTGVLHYPEEVAEYMRAVASASPRVRVETMGMSEEGREMLLVVVSDEATLNDLERYKAITAALGDPRRTSPAEAERLIEEAKPMYWALGAIHSGETGSPEMLMELVYRLAVSEAPEIRAIRDNLIVMITPVVEPDGRAKQVDLHMGKRKDPDADLPGSLLYWGKYVAHDNNRDGSGLSLALSRHVTKTFLEWNPLVMHDLHESASYLYTSTGRGPYNAWIDPMLISEWNRLAHKEVKDLSGFGVPGVYTHNFYDGWSPNYMIWAANMRNSIGRFYETQGARDASAYIVRGNVDREWHRPSTPLPEVVWNIRNNVNLQQSGLLVAMGEVADARREFMRNYYQKAQRSVAKATMEGPAAYVLPADDDRPGMQARLIRILQQLGIEVHRTTEDAEADERTLPAGSYVVRLDQPFSRSADMLLDWQYYNPNDPAPYDDVGWTLGALYDTETVRVEDTSFLSTAMQLQATTPVAPHGVTNASGARAFLVRYDASNPLTTFRYRHPELVIEAAEAAFSAGGEAYGPGSWIIPVDGNGDVASLLEEAGRELGFRAVGVREVPGVARHPVRTPRVAVMHTWQSTQSEGWLRVGLDEYLVPYDYISVHDVRDTPELRAKYDVILFGPSSGNALSVVRGRTGDEPQPWLATAITPNLGRQASTPDMRGGLELAGVTNLDRFVREGGVFVTLTTSASVPIHFGLVEGVSVRETEELWAPGGVFRTERADATSPIAYGFPEELGVYFGRGPVLQAQGFNARGSRAPGDPGSTTARRSGRGGVDEEDQPQARGRDWGQAGVEAYRAWQDSVAAAEEEEAAATPEARGNRVIYRFTPDQERLLVSGGLTNGHELAGTAALVDAPLGEGHIVMFAFNPFWRGLTLGSYAMLFNTLLHHDALDAGQLVADQDDGNGQRQR